MSNIIYNVSDRKLSFKAAHITDIHIKDVNNVNWATRFPLFKEKLFGHNIDLIINTGDTADSASLTTNQGVVDFINELNAFKPTITVRGNHDNQVTNAELGMPATNNYVQDFGDKWRFIVLYSGNVHPYSIGATQRTWLNDTLAATPVEKNICILSHVPTLSVAAMMWYLRNGSTQWSSNTDQHTDCKLIIDILKLYPNIKVYLSGHEHTIDRVEHEGIIYLNSGAVCANWWNNNAYVEKGYPAGYRLIDFYDDGTIRESFITY